MLRSAAFVRPTARRARAGVSLMFFTNGVLFSALLPRYPELKSSFDLDNTQFGLLVVSFPVGALLSAALAGRVIRRLGTIRTTVLGSFALAAAVTVAAASPGVWLFAAALMVGGAVDAVVDAAQNVQGVLVEEWRGRSVLNSFHAVWSAGAATGGAIGAAAAAAGVAPGVQTGVNGAVWSLVAVIAARLAVVPERDASRRPDDTVHRERAGAMVRRSAWVLLLPLVALAICGTLVEDVANNWAVLYLRSETRAPDVVAGLGFSTVLVAQLVGRLTGDTMTDRWGRDAVARTGSLLIAGGALLVVAAPGYVGALLGLALTGFGCATLVPAAFAAAGRIPGLPEGSGIAVLGWLMRLGFLLTSPAVGRISDASSLRTAMLIPVGAGVVGAMVAHGQRRRHRGAGPSGAARPVHASAERSAGVVVPGAAGARPDGEW